MADVTQAPPEFDALCRTLFGGWADVDAIWSEVEKFSPGPSDVSTPGESKARRNIERASNAIGITAGTLGLAAAAKDERLEHGGKFARGLYATGKKVPKVVGRIKNPKVQAGLAAGALGTQVANLGGDALIAGTLAKPQGKRKADVTKGMVEVRKAGLGALFKLPPGVEEAAAGTRKLWGKMTTGIGKTPKAATTVSGQPTLPGLDTKTVPNPNAMRSAGQNIMGAARSKEGQTGMAIGAGGAVTAGAVSRRRQSSSQDYLIGKSDDTELIARGEFSKFVDEKRQAFGWASIVTKDGSPVVDRQGDYIDINDLEDAAYRYVHKSRVGGDMHRRNGEAPHHVSDMIESVVFTPEKIEKMGLPSDFPQGWWVGYQIHDEDTWQEVRKGGRTGFSIHGRGIRKDHDLDELMGYR